MKAKIVLKSFPNHLGIPGHQGGSLPMGADKGGGEGGQVSVDYGRMDTIDKIARPVVRAKQYAEETQFVDVTVGTEKQIKYAKDLRNNLIIEATARENDANVRWAVIKQGPDRHERLTDSDISILAHDAWIRRTLKKINIDDAKTIIDTLAHNNIQGEQNRLHLLGLYADIIRHPTMYYLADGKSWKKRT